MLSLPPPPLITSDHGATRIVIVTCSDSRSRQRKRIAYDVDLVLALSLTVTVSAGWRPPVSPLRSMATSFTPVPVSRYHDVVGAARGLELMRSTPLRSMVTLPASKANVAGRHWPNADVFSLMLAPRNRACRNLSSTLNDVAAVARIPDEQVMPRSSATVLPRPDDGVAPPPPMSRSLHRRPDDVPAAATVDDVISRSS